MLAGRSRRGLALRRARRAYRRLATVAAGDWGALTPWAPPPRLISCRQCDRSPGYVIAQRQTRHRSGADDIAVGAFAENPSRKHAPPFVVALILHGQLDKGAGFGRILPRRGLFACAQLTMARLTRADSPGFISSSRTRPLRLLSRPSTATRFHRGCALGPADSAERVLTSRSSDGAALPCDGVRSHAARARRPQRDQRTSSAATLFAGPPGLAIAGRCARWLPRKTSALAGTRWRWCCRSGSASAPFPRAVSAAHQYCQQWCSQPCHQRTRLASFDLLHHPATIAFFGAEIPVAKAKSSLTFSLFPAVSNVPTVAVPPGENLAQNAWPRRLRQGRGLRKRRNDRSWPVGVDKSAALSLSKAPVREAPFDRLRATVMI